MQELTTKIPCIPPLDIEVRGTLCYTNTKKTNIGLFLHTYALQDQYHTHGCNFCESGWSQIDLTMV